MEKRSESATEEIHKIGSKPRSCLTILIERRTKMSEKMLTEEGLLAVPTTSNDDLLDIGEIDVTVVDETNDEEESNLSEPDPEPSQRSPKDAKKKKDKKENRRGTTSDKKYQPQDQKRNQNRKRRYSETLSEERIIEQSEEAALKALNTEAFPKRNMPKDITIQSTSTHKGR